MKKLTSFLIVLFLCSNFLYAHPRISPKTLEELDIEKKSYLVAGYIQAGICFWGLYSCSVYSIFTGFIFGLRSKNCFDNAAKCEIPDEWVIYE